MKVTLDISQLLEKGQITHAEHDRLLSLSRESTRSHAWSVLFVLAALACTVGFIVWKSALFLPLFHTLLDLFGERGVNLLLIILLLGSGVAVKSGFLVAAGVVAILSYVGGSTFYSHASYYVAITEPALTILVFSVLSAIGLFLSRLHDVPSAYERLALVFARTSLFIVNMGFWVGSLWGSPVGTTRIPGYCFALLWAVALVAVGAWGAKEGRRFVVNLVAVFGSIHFYTQWFERLGASPASVMCAGLVALAILYGLRTYNRAFS